MKHAVALAIVLALGVGTAHARSCTDPTTHKFVKCTAAASSTEPATIAPAKKPSMLSGLMKPKTTSTPAQSPAPASSSSAMASGGAVTQANAGATAAAVSHLLFASPEFQFC